MPYVGVIVKLIRFVGKNAIVVIRYVMGLECKNGTTKWSADAKLIFSGPSEYKNM